MLSTIVLLPFIVAALIPVMGRASRNTILALLVTGALVPLVGLMFQAPTVWRAGLVLERHDWVPELGLNVEFFADALGLSMASLILGIGILVAIYSRFYLAAEDSYAKLASMLALFQGSMLGIVLSDNVLLLILFWELTSLSSFLLIGFWSGRADSQRGARNALIVTGLGGLALLAGALLLGHAAGSFQLTTILGQAETLRDSPLYVPILLLVLIGCFAKSAQVPFQFWLPGAMAAPTPVSAYLHSATMVKAGLFLLARLWPVLAGPDWWFMIVSLVGLVTMLWGAWVAIFKTDLKALLAYSTISHLGMIVMLLGMDTKVAAAAAVFHVLNHALFKASLFLCAGIVEHETGTRDLRRLGGLARTMPITATLACLSALAMAGVPFLNGFLSKEMMLEAAAHTHYLGLDWLFPILATLGAAMSALYSFRFVLGVFFGRARVEPENAPHDPSPGLWLPVACLVVPSVIIGVAPGPTVERLVERVTSAVTGPPPASLELALWHGVTPAFWMTVVAFASALLALPVAHRLDRLYARLVLPPGDDVLDRILRGLQVASHALGSFTANGSLRRYFTVMICSSIVIGGGVFFSSTSGTGGREFTPLNPVGVVGWIVVLAASVMVIVIHHHRLLAIVATSLAGLVVSLIFLQSAAPDLALTQLSVEVVTVILLLLALNYLPKTTARSHGLLRHLAEGGIAILAGTAVGGTLFAILRRDLDSISGFYLDMAKPAGGGANVVNVILVDFRGYDTLGEICVLAIAALIIYALLQSSLRGAAAGRLAAWPHNAQAGDSHPLLLVVLTRLLLPMALLVALYLFLRGHQEPGGGFIAGLVVGVMLVLQYMASGYAWASRRLTVDYHGLVALGVLVALATGMAAIVAGHPFLTSAFGYLHMPMLGELELASAMVFDLGVVGTVVGVVMLMLAGLSRISSLAEPVDASGPLTVALERGEDHPDRRNLHPAAALDGHEAALGNPSAPAAEAE